MKTFRILIALASATCFSALAADTPAYEPTTLTLSNATVAASSATNQNSIIDCRKQRDLAVALTFKSDASGTGIMTVKLAPSVDGLKFDTVHTVTFGGAMISAGTEITTATNFTTLGYGYYKVLYITNADGSANATNCSLKFGQGVLAK